MNGAGAFYGSNFFGGTVPTPILRPGRTSYSGSSGTGFPSEHDSTPPSGLIGLHQKLDMLVSHNTEHTSAMEEMKKENSALKEQLCSIKEEMKTLHDLCTVSSSSPTPRSQVKIPPVVSVSLAGKMYASC